jgi:hypothetical protein
MAYCIENSLYKDVLEKPNDYPYNVVRIVADHICPDLCSDPLNLIAICDACLMYYNPGEILFLALSHFKTIDYKKLTPEKIYDIIIELQSFDSLGVNNTKDLFNKLSLLACQQINDYFTTQNYKENKSWVTQTFNAANRLRVNKPYFMIDIAKMGCVKENPIFMFCLNTIGCPVTLNDDKSTIVPIVDRMIDVEKIDPSCFWTISQIYSIFSNEGTLKHDTYKCEMIEWCKKSFEKRQVG